MRGGLAYDRSMVTPGLFEKLRSRPSVEVHDWNQPDRVRPMASRRMAKLCDIIPSKSRFVVKSICPMDEKCLFLLDVQAQLCGKKPKDYQVEAVLVSSELKPVCHDEVDGYRAMVAGALSSLAETGLCPHYCFLYMSYRHRWRVNLFQEKFRSLRKSIERAECIQGMAALSWLFQVAFALAYAQNVAGLMHNGLNIDTVGIIPCKSKTLTYKWNGLCFEIPAKQYGVIKIMPCENSSVLVLDERIGPCSSYSTDLANFAQSLRPVLIPKLKGEGCKAVVELLNLWAKCTRKGCSLPSNSYVLDHFECPEAFPASQATRFGAFQAKCSKANFTLDETSQ